MIEFRDAVVRYPNAAANAVDGVLFPLPLGPATAVSAPRRAVKRTPSTAFAAAFG